MISSGAVFDRSNNKSRKVSLMLPMSDISTSSIPDGMRCSGAIWAMISMKGAKLVDVVRVHRPSNTRKSLIRAADMTSLINLVFPIPA